MIRRRMFCGWCVVIVVLNYTSAVRYDQNNGNVPNTPMTQGELEHRDAILATQGHTPEHIMPNRQLAINPNNPVASGNFGFQGNNANGFEFPPLNPSPLRQMRFLNRKMVPKSTAKPIVQSEHGIIRQEHTVLNTISEPIDIEPRLVSEHLQRQMKNRDIKPLATLPIKTTKEYIDKAPIVLNTQSEPIHMNQKHFLADPRLHVYEKKVAPRFIKPKKQKPKCNGVKRPGCVAKQEYDANGDPLFPFEQRDITAPIIDSKRRTIGGRRPEVILPDPRTPVYEKEAAPGLVKQKIPLKPKCNGVKKPGCVAKQEYDADGNPLFPFEQREVSFMDDLFPINSSPDSRSPVYEKEVAPGFIKPKKQKPICNGVKRPGCVAKQEYDANGNPLFPFEQRDITASIIDSKRRTIGGRRPEVVLPDPRTPVYEKEAAQGSVKQKIPLKPKCNGVKRPGCVAKQEYDANGNPIFPFEQRDITASIIDSKRRTIGRRRPAVVLPDPRTPVYEKEEALGFVKPKKQKPNCIGVKRPGCVAKQEYDADGNPLFPFEQREVSFMDDLFPIKSSPDSRSPVFEKEVAPGFVKPKKQTPKCNGVKRPGCVAKQEYDADGNPLFPFEQRDITASITDSRKMPMIKPKISKSQPEQSGLLGDIAPRPPRRGFRLPRRRSKSKPSKAADSDVKTNYRRGLRNFNG